MIGILNPEEIEDVLSQQFLGRLGCYADDMVYIVPISYVYDGKYVYLHTREGLKVEMMRKNQKVCFETEIMINMANWKSVIAWGNSEEVSDKSDRDRALNMLLNRILPIISSETTHLSPQWPFPPDNLDSIKGIVYRIELERKTGRFETKDVYTPPPF